MAIRFLDEPASVQQPQIKTTGRIRFLDEPTQPRTRTTQQGIIPQREQLSFGKTALTGIKNIPASTIKLPFNLVKGIIGMAKSVIPNTPENKQLVQLMYKSPDLVAEGLAKAYVQPEATAQEIFQSINDKAMNDPTGLAFDIGMILTPGGAAISGIKGAEKVGKAIETVGRTGLQAPLAFPKALGYTGKLPTKLIPKAPFKKFVDVEAVETAKKYGVELPASSVTKARPVKYLEALSEEGLFGGRLTELKAKAAQDISKIGDDIIKSAGTVSDDFTAGNVILKKVNQFEDVSKKSINKAYENVLKPIREYEASYNKPYVKGKVAVNNTIKKLNEIIPEIEKVSADVNDAKLFRSYLGDLRKIENKNVKISTAYDKITALKNSVNGRIKSWNDPFTQRNSTYLQNVWHTLDDDLEMLLEKAVPDIAELKAAKTMYKQYKGRLDEEWINKASKYADDPDKLAKQLINPNMTENDILRIRSVVGEEGMKNVRAKVLDDIITKGVSEKTGFYTPTGIQKGISKYDTKKLSMILTKDQLTKVKDLDKLVKSYHEGGAVGAGSKTAFMGKILFLLVDLVTTPLQALKFIAGDASFSAFMTSPTGRKWLTTGLEQKPQIFQKMLTGAEMNPYPLGAMANKFEERMSNQKGNVLLGKSSLETEALKYKTPEEFVNKPNFGGIIPEYGTRNQYFDMTSKQELEAVAEGKKPAYLGQHGEFGHNESAELAYAKQNGLVFKRKGKDIVIARNYENIDKVLRADTGRELGLALGYEDLGKTYTKSQLTEIWNKAHGKRS